MIKKPKSKNDLSKIPFEFDKSSGMLKSTAELLQSLKTNYQFDANFTDTSSFFNQLSQNAFEPQQYVGY
jgi:hypothetical protein